MKYPNPQNILIKKYGVIFCIMQKNASSTILAQIVEILKMKKSTDFPTDVHRPKLYPYPRVSDIDLLKDFEHYLRFCIIRNPWERLVSCYKDKVMQAENNFFWASCSRFRGGMSFEAFVDVVASLSEEESDPHFGSQLYRLLGDDGNLLVNYFCNLETLNKHVAEIAKATGTPFQQMPRLNTTKQSTYQEFYTPELIQKVNKRFATDIEFFKFEFGKKNDRFSFGFIDADTKAASTDTKYLTPFFKEKQQLLKQEVEGLKEEIVDRQKQITEIKNSLSWKITAPLRKIGSWFGKK